MENFFKNIFNKAPKQISKEEAFEHINSNAMLQEDPTKNKRDLKEFERMVVDKDGHLGLEESYSTVQPDPELAKIRARQADAKEETFK